MTITKPKKLPTLTEIVAVRVSEAELGALVALARALDRPLSYVIRNALRRCVEQQGA